MTVATDSSAAPPARFDADPGSIAAARRHVRRQLLAWGIGDDLVDDALVLISELATNAVMHAGTAFDVHCLHLGTAVRLEVQDHYPGRGLPAVLAAPDPSRPNGRGLLLCASLSSAWGVEYTPTAKTVWCRLDLSPPDVAAAAAGAAGPHVASVVGVIAAARAVESGARAGQSGPVGQAGPAGQSGRAEPAGRLGPAGQAVEPAPDVEWASFTEADQVRLRFDDMLSRATDQACDAFHGDAAYLLLAGGDGLDARLASTGLPPPPAPVRGLQLADQPAVEALPAVYAEVDPAVLPLLAGAGMRSAVVAQLLAEGRPIGQLCVASARPGRFSADDASRLQHGADRLALAVAARRLAESTRRHRDWLGFLAEASDLLAGTLDPQMTIAMLAQLVVPRLAGWCAIRLYDDRGPTGLDYAWHADETQIDLVRRLLDAAPAELAAVDGTPGPVTALLGAGPARAGGSAGAARAGGAPGAAGAVGAAVPAALRGDIAVSLALRARGRRLGIAVLGRPAGDPFEPDTLSFAEELTRRAALALDNALLYRMHRATSQALQRSLLPAALPEVPGLDVGVAYQAAGEGLVVGGDFYDLFALGNDRWRFAVGDVAGNGPEAAGDTGLARHTLRLLGRQLCPPAEAVAQLNRAILQEHDRTRFITLLHGEITRRPTGGLQIDLVVAGHPLPYLLRPGRADPVGTSQPLVGVVADVPYRTDTILLAPGETLLCLTDGVIERRRNGRILGETDLQPLLRRSAALSAAALVAAVQRAVIEYAPQPPRDDMAILALHAT